MRSTGIKFILSVLLISLSACTAAQPEAEAVPVTIDIDMTEYAFNPTSLNLAAGQQVTLNLTNSGVIQHEIMFGREVMRMEDRPSGYMTDMFEAGGVEPQVHIMNAGELMDEMHEEDAHAGFMVVLGPGGQAALTFTVTAAMAGDWEMGCFEQDGVHYDAGMYGPVSVSR
jgi:uncharacterized cupredoxin-like copper-binding protein